MATKFNIGDIVRDASYDEGESFKVVSSIDSDGMYLLQDLFVNTAIVMPNKRQDFYRRAYPQIQLGVFQKTGRIGWHIGAELSHITVKDTKIARAFHKNNINKIEDGLIWLKS